MDLSYDDVYKPPNRERKRPARRTPAFKIIGCSGRKVKKIWPRRDVLLFVLSRVAGKAYSPALQ